MYGYTETYRVWNDDKKLNEALDNFLLETPKRKRWGNFKIVGGKETPRELIYQTVSNDSYSQSKETLTDVIATTLPNGKVLGNASILPLIGRQVSYGNETPNRSVTKIQTLMEGRKEFDSIPFSVFQEADLNLATYNELDSTGEETVTRKVQNPKWSSWKKDETVPEFIEETVHFMGARLFSVQNHANTERAEKNGVLKKIKFLFDIDRKEIDNKIFNPFLVQVPENGTPITSINQAYDCLMPNEVKDAIANGKHVKRQGEWFFIPTETNPLSQIASLTEEQRKEYALALAIKDQGRWNNTLTEMLGEELTEKYKNIGNIPESAVKRMELRAGKNRPNHAEKGINTGGKSYVKGKVEHSGREHADIVLEGWHIALPNTAIDSFTITGDID
jgi:hypothetical protein